MTVSMTTATTLKYFREDYENDIVELSTLPTEPGTVYFCDPDGKVYDWCDSDAWETVQNFCTGSQCGSVVIATGIEPSEADIRAYMIAAKERALYADCFYV